MICDCGIHTKHRLHCILNSTPTLVFPVCLGYDKKIIKNSSILT